MQVFARGAARKLAQQHEAKIHDPHAKIGELTVERDFLSARVAALRMEAVYRRPRTSVADSEHRIFPYLLRDLAISRADHVWCADITYPGFLSAPWKGALSWWVRIPPSNCRSSW